MNRELPKVCVVCKIPDHMEKTAHPTWCGEIKALHSRVHELETAVGTLTKDLNSLAKAAGPAISGSILYK